LSCVTGYYLNGNSCLFCFNAIPNCNQCTNSSYCSLCADGNSGVTCASCTSAQYLDATNYLCKDCSVAIAHCLSCSSNTSCISCVATFTLYSSTNCSCTVNQYIDNTGSCAFCNDSIIYCSTCSDATTCTACSSTFVLVSSSCTCSTDSYLTTLPSC